MRSKVFLTTEFLFLFAALPLVVYAEILPLPKLLLLLVFTFYTAVLLIKDKSFKTNDLYRFAFDRKAIKAILLRFLPAAVVLTLVTIIMQPEMLLIFPREKPMLWLIVMLLYPLLSAYPQELIYRAFLMHRYRNIFPTGLMLFWVSVISFSFLHIIYDNWIAVVFSLAGGYLFTKTYRETNSLMAAAIEHALYGCFVFTIGLGNFFYEGNPS